MNIILINAYFQVTEGETETKKYVVQLAERWIQIYPDKQFTGKHLVAQVKNIETRKLLAPDEIERMKTESINNSPSREVNTIRRSIHRRSTLQQIPVNFDEHSASQHNTEPEPNEVAIEIMALFQEVSAK